MAHGGRRPGAGRPKDSGKLGEKTVTVRVPQSRVSEVQDYLVRPAVPFYQS